MLRRKDAPTSWKRLGRLFLFMGLHPRKKPRQVPSEALAGLFVGAEQPRACRRWMRGTAGLTSTPLTATVVPALNAGKPRQVERGWRGFLLRRQRGGSLSLG